MFWKKRKTIPVMTPEELARAFTEEISLVIVDVRSPQQFRDGHLPGAINIPLSELERRASEFDLASETVFY
jgi:rhodanese-related sulfurtransferase